MSMVCWICPECGRENDANLQDCPGCAPLPVASPAALSAPVPHPQPEEPWPVAEEPVPVSEAPVSVAQPEPAPIAEALAPTAVGELAQITEPDEPITIAGPWPVAQAS